MQEEYIQPSNLPTREAPRQRRFDQTSKFIHSSKKSPPPKNVQFSQELMINPSDDERMNRLIIYLYIV